MPWQKEGYLPSVLVEKNRIAEYDDFEILIQTTT